MVMTLPIRHRVMTSPIRHRVMSQCDQSVTLSVQTWRPRNSPSDTEVPSILMEKQGENGNWVNMAEIDNC